jgi:DNA-binding beta-propeller fold protein YncE
MKSPSQRALFAPSLLALACLSCGMSDSETGALPGLGNVGGSPDGMGPNAGGSVTVPGTGGASTGGAAGAGGAIVVPPEEELEESFLAPVVTGKYVFSANPKSGRVAVIDAETFAVRLFNAGFGPTYMSAIPGGRGAIVINDTSDDATLFHLAGDDVSVDEVALPVHAEANAWAISPDARFALAWTRSEPSQADDPTSGSQDVTVLDLQRMTSKRLSVGFHPTKALVDDASERAYVVNDEGVSVITLGDDPEVELLARVSEDPLEEAAARDVSILPDGSFAVVRVDGSSLLRIVDLSREDAIQSFDLGAPVTDVDLSHDGSLAVAALPGIGQIALVPVPPTGDAASFERVSIPGEITSSVALSQGAELALLYQNGADNSHLTLLDLREGMGRALRTVDVKGPVSAAFAAPGAASAILFQKPIRGSAKAGLFSGVPTLQKRSAKIVGTDAVPSALAFDDQGRYALVTVGNEASAAHGVYRVQLDTLQEDYLPLASPPATAATGIVEEVERGFVAQTHPEGRITFIDLSTARAHTITGFELAARILQ